MLNAKLKKLLFWVPAFTPLYLVRLYPFGFPTNLFELIVIIALVGLVSKITLTSLLAFIKQYKVFAVGVFFLCFGLVTSPIYGQNQLVSLGILKSWFILPILFSYLLYTSLSKESEVILILRNIFLSTFLVALVAFAYKLTGTVTYDGRLSAFYLSPNYLAMFLAPGFFIGCFLITRALSTSKKVSIGLIFYLTAVAFIAISLYWTYSYATWLGLLFGLFFWILAKNGFVASKKIFISTALILLFAFFGLLFAQLNSPKLQALTSFSDRSSLASRIMIWQASWKIIVEHPLFGVGAGNFQSTYLSYQEFFPPYLEWAVPQPHNLYLAFWLQAGLLGLLGFLLLIFSLFSSLWKRIRKKQGEQLASLFLVIFIYILTYGLVDTPYWKNDLSFLFWIFAFLATFNPTARNSSK